MKKSAKFFLGLYFMMAAALITTNSSFSSNSNAALKVTFDNEPVGSLPPTILQGKSIPDGNVYVVDATSSPPDPFGGDSNRSITVYQQSQDMVPRLVFSVHSSGQSEIQKGRWKMRFWPDDDTNRSPRCLMSIGSQGEYAVVLQCIGRRFFLIDSEGVAKPFDQAPVRLGEENALDIEFDTIAGTFRGTLNGVILSYDGKTVLPISKTLNEITEVTIWLRGNNQRFFFDDIILESEEDSIGETTFHPANSLLYTGPAIGQDSNNITDKKPLGTLVIDITLPPDATTLPEGDQRPARVELDFIQLLQKAKLKGVPDLSTLHIVRLNEKGEPVPGAKFAYANDPFCVPFRWDDASIPEDFPSVEKPVNPTTGKLERELIPKGGNYFNVSGEGLKGNLVWTHTRMRNDIGPNRYRISVDILPQGSPTSDPPRGWIGDGVARFTDRPPSTTGSSHTRIDITDWNGDGLPDIIYGESAGYLFVLPNRGTMENPVFDRAQFICDADGLPIDAGSTSAPHIVDWDGDGHDDLLVGTHWNRILFFRNVATEGTPRFEYVGPITLDGKPLELPIEPIIGRPAKAFFRDYYPVIETVDWDGDGKLDLIAGGYVTGRMFVFKNVGRSRDGTPILKALGPITTADGEPINVGDWSAAPTIADFNGDGLFDIISGNFPMSRESQAKDTPLKYYKNVGTVQKPIFQEEALSIEGNPPRGALYTPRAVDLNNDDLIDLVVSSGSRIFWLENIGDKNTPKFRIREEFSPTWGNSPLPAGQFLDWNGDGLPDAVHNYTVFLNSGSGDPFLMTEKINILPPGVNIAHPSGIGDDWFYPRLFDFNGNGEYDILFGDWYGQIWLHRKLDDGSYDVEGVLLRLESGDPIKVGPKGDLDPETNFRALQGARTVFTAHDFTGDGKTDIVTGDTFGIVKLFENVGTNEEPVFREAQELGNLGNRLSVDKVDWDEDGCMDVIAGSANGRVAVFLNQPNQPSHKRFAAAIDPGIPPIPQPRIITVDLNTDGDVDLFLPSTQGSVWLERSFLRHGYAEGKITEVNVTYPSKKD